MGSFCVCLWTVCTPTTAHINANSVQNTNDGKWKALFCFILQSEFLELLSAFITTYNIPHLFWLCPWRYMFQTWVFNILTLPHSVHLTLYPKCFPAPEMTFISLEQSVTVQRFVTRHKIALPWFSSEHHFSPLGKLGLCQSAPDVADELECIFDNLWFLPGDSPIWPMSAYFVIQAGDFAVHSHWRFYYL